MHILFLIILAFFLIKALFKYIALLFLTGVMFYLISFFIAWLYSDSTAKMTPIERKMFRALKVAGYNPIPQYYVKPYKLDFAIFYNNIKLDIECDGRAYHSSPQQKDHDKRRTGYLNSKGWNVIRFTGTEINRNTNRCVQRICRKLNRLHNTKKKPLARLLKKCSS